MHTYRLWGEVEVVSKGPALPDLDLNTGPIAFDSRFPFHFPIFRLQSEINTAPCSLLLLLQLLLLLPRARN